MGTITSTHDRVLCDQHPPAGKRYGRVGGWLGVSYIHERRARAKRFLAHLARGASALPTAPPSYVANRDARERQ